jgi:autoinducer 2-degrading protein
VHIVHVSVRVKPEYVEAFGRAAAENASHSVAEPGCARFDVVQSTEDPTRFVLVEAYYSEADVTRHKATAHYMKWRDTVAEMMAEPRVGEKYVNVFPADDGWA